MTNVSQSGPQTSAVAQRYANSLYDLAVETKQLPQTEKDLTTIDNMLAESADLQRMVRSPVFSAEDQLNAMSALAAKAGIKGIVINFLSIVAQNRRLFVLQSMITAFRALAAEKRGEVSAEVTAAKALTAAEKKELEATLKGASGKAVTMNVTVDPAILGGLIVKIGSQQIDTSLRTKLNSLKLALKEVG